MSRTRTFLAVEASHETRRRAIELIEQLRCVARDIKWVAPPNLHWTLQFLGDVDDTDLASVCGRVAEATQDIEPFLLEAGGAGAFPSPRRPRTVWLGAVRGCEEMARLQNTIERTLAGLGFRGENRQYVPHLTLGRVGRGENRPSLTEILAKFSDYDGGTAVVEEVVIFGSVLGREGPTYHVIGRAPLRPI
jgi:2'-5' RNA ligase